MQQLLLIWTRSSRMKTRESSTDLDTNHTREDESNPARSEGVRAGLSDGSFESRLLRARLLDPWVRFRLTREEPTAVTLATSALPKRTSRCPTTRARAGSASGSIRLFLV